MNFQKFKTMLDKQKLVDGVVRNQHLPKNEVAELLLHKQHESELLQAIRSHSPAELGQVLDNLPLEDARLLWSKIPPSIENPVLWELSGQRRQELVDDREPVFGNSEVNVFELVDGRLRQIRITGKHDLANVQPVWVDLINTTRAERAFIGAHFAVELPDPLDVMDLEVTARFHIEDNNDVHLHSNFLHEKDAHSVPVAFILHNGVLFSLRNEELPVFQLQKKLARTQPNYVKDSVDLLLDLYGADIECSADSLENIYAALGRVGRLVLSEQASDDQAAATLAEIAKEEDRNGRIRSNILDTQRALIFLMRGRFLNPAQIEDAKQILHNIESLNSHTSFLFDKINFLMDSTIGFININQNKRVNQLTVLSVVFMPINILAGMGGMSEFSMMTQGIPWPLAFGAFAVGSGLIGLATYIGLRYFERQRLQKSRRPAHT